MASANNRKHGNNKEFCKRYRAQNRKLKNQEKKIERDKRRKAAAHAKRIARLKAGKSVRKPTYAELAQYQPNRFNAAMIDEA